MNNHFDQAAALWDQDEQKVRMAESIAGVMIRNLNLKPDQVVMDYGTGTGLIALKLRPHVRQVLAVDTSQGMLDKLKEKLARMKIVNVEVLKASVEDGNDHFPAVDVIISSMTLHHIQDTAKVAKEFWMALKPGGQIAIADLDEDNGEFHSDPNSARHNGFNRPELQKVFESTGFKEIEFHEAYTRIKFLKNGKEKEFTIFLMTANKPPQ